MKKFLIISTLLLFSVATNAQLFNVFGHEVGFIYIGPKVGGTFSTISNFSDMSGNSTQYRMAYQLGAVGEFGFTSKFSFQTELLFYSRGTKMDAASSKIKMNYIGIPLLAKYAFKAFGLTKIYAMGGTFTDIRTKGVEEYAAVGAQPAMTVDLPDGFKKYDWGLAFGAGAEYPTKSGIWALDFRYNLGLTDITDSSLGSTKTKSRSFGLSLTYKLDLVDLFSKLKNRNKDKNKESTQGK
jgi:hypothetical protein